jgi:hypothetical protein
MRVWSLEERDVERRGRPRGSIGKVRAVHHLVARLYARNIPVRDIAGMVNRTPATIRNWINAPANQELVAQYARENEVEVTTELEYRMQLARYSGTLAREKIAAQLENGEIENTRVLLAIAADTDDRTGMGKIQTQINLQGDLGARLNRARQRVRDLNSKKEITGVVQGNVIKLKRRC